MKRVYNEDGTKSCPLWLMVAIHVVAIPLIVPWVFVGTLVKETGNSFWYAWHRAAEEVDAAKRILRSAR